MINGGFTSHIVNYSRNWHHCYCETY